MPWIKVPDPAGATGLLGKLYEQIRTPEGHVDHILQVHGLRPRTLQAHLGLYKAVIIPQAWESLASAEAAYTTNRQDFLDLLDAERVLFQVRLTYSRLLADYWIALADVELALGRSFPDGGSQP